MPSSLTCVSTIPLQSFLQFGVLLFFLLTFMFLVRFFCVCLPNAPSQFIFSGIPPIVCFLWRSTCVISYLVLLVLFVSFVSANCSLAPSTLSLPVHGHQCFVSTSPWPWWFVSASTWPPVVCLCQPLAPGPGGLSSTMIFQQLALQAKSFVPNVSNIPLF